MSRKPFFSNVAQLVQCVHHFIAPLKQTTRHLALLLLGYSDRRNHDNNCYLEPLNTHPQKSLHEDEIMDLWQSDTQQQTIFSVSYYLFSNTH